jgi:hypothetical protein
VDLSADTDGDGAPDYIEDALGTDPALPADNPSSRGMIVVIEPYNGTPSAAPIEIAPLISKADVFFLMDATGSLGGTLGALSSGLSTVIIPSLSSTLPGTAVGIGTYGDFPTDTYGYATDIPFSLKHRVMTMNSSTAISSLQTVAQSLAAAGGADGPESSWEALHQVATGAGTYEGGAAVPPWNAATAYPAAIPSGEEAGTLPGAGFRDGALRVIVWCTDAPGHNSSSFASYDYSGITSPSSLDVVGELSDGPFKVIGIRIGSDAEAKEDQFFAVNATYSRVPEGVVGGLAKDANGDCPLQLDVPYDGAGFANAVVAAYSGLVGHAKFERMSVVLTDDPSDGVDAVASFAQYVQAEYLGGPAVIDTNHDGHPDAFLKAAVGSSLSFTLMPRTNASVAQGGSAKVYKAELSLNGDGHYVLGKRTVCFVVPPKS